MDTFSRSVVEVVKGITAELARNNEAESRAFREQNASRQGVRTMPSGVQIEVRREGQGRSPRAASRILVRYQGSLIDGTVFGRSPEDGDPVEFEMTRLVPGLREAVRQMSVGGMYRVVVPGELGYGMEGMGRFVSPNATLIFDIELVQIVP